MKLYLSSYRLGDKGEKLAEMVGLGNKIAVIGNAMDFLDKKERIVHIKENVEELKEIGLIPVEIDLRNYFGRPEEMAEKMNEFGAVYVRGGNVFLLRRAFAESGFDKYLLSKRNDPNFVFSGYSAGPCVLSPSLKGMELVDDPNHLGVGYNPKIIWDGLGILDYAFVPHFESNHEESESVGRSVVYYKKNNIPFKTLHDGEVIISSI